MANDDTVAAADERLLERLNALKPSTVRLQREKKPVDFGTDSPISLGPSSHGPLYGDLNGFSNDGLEEGVALESLLDGDAIEELIGSIDQREDLTFQPPNDSVQVQRLLAGASDFVHDSTIIGSTTEKLSSESQAEALDNSRDFLTYNDKDSSSDEVDDEIEASRYVEEALNEVKRLHRDNLHEPDGLKTSAQGSDSSSNRDNEDDALSYQFTAFSLPSVPKDLPRLSEERTEQNTSPECCCICYDTATTKCIDCEGGLLFCVRCWREMHEDDGVDQQHKCVKYEPS